MNLVFDIASSIEFWRQRYPGDRMPQGAQSVPPADCAFRMSDIKLLLPEWVDDDFLAPTGGVFHVLALDGQRARTFVSVKVHAWSGRIPEGSFYELRPGVYVESPEFMFLHAATILPFSQLVAFGDELCGRYSFDRREKRGFRKRKKSLATKASLDNFLQQSAGCPGRNKALRALPHVVEGSASPMETFDELTMCLPPMRGGYALAKMTMNKLVPLTEKAARIAGREKCYLDMSVDGSDIDIDIEHHGKLDHSTDEEKESDFARVSGLKEMGYEVIELTRKQVGDLFAYEAIIQRVARLIRKRIPKEVLGATPARIELREQLFAWNKSSGRIR